MFSPLYERQKCPEWKGATRREQLSSFCLFGVGFETSLSFLSFKQWGERKMRITQSVQGGSATTFSSRINYMCPRGITAQFARHATHATPTTSATTTTWTLCIRRYKLPIITVRHEDAAGEFQASISSLSFPFPKLAYGCGGCFKYIVAWLSVRACPATKKKRDRISVFRSKFD